jgi:hypothetical protein
MWSANSGTPRSYLPAAYIPGGTSSKAKTLIATPDMGAGSAPPSRASIVHHGADELLIQQDPVPDGEITLLEGSRPCLAFCLYQLSRSYSSLQILLDETRQLFIINFVISSNKLLDCLKRRSPRSFKLFIAFPTISEVRG